MDSVIEYGRVVARSGLGQALVCDVCQETQDFDDALFTAAMLPNLAVQEDGVLEGATQVCVAVRPDSAGEVQLWDLS